MVVVLYAADTCPTPLLLEACGLWNEKNGTTYSWGDKVDKVTNRDVLQRVNETRNIPDTICRRKHAWTCS